MATQPEPAPYKFKDDSHKKDSIIQSMQLSREMFPRNPPKGVKDHTNLLLYLGMIYLMERTLAKKMIDSDAGKKKEVGRKFGFQSNDALGYMHAETKLRKAANKFLVNPTKTALLLSSISH